VALVRRRCGGHPTSPPRSPTLTNVTVPSRRTLECREAVGEYRRTRRFRRDAGRAPGTVLEIQTKLHRWAISDPGRRVDDLYNLVADPAFLLVAWDRVRSNKRSRTAGVDCKTARYIESVQRCQSKQRSFRPVPVRERMIPKANGKMRRLGIPTVATLQTASQSYVVLRPVDILRTGGEGCSV